MLHRLGLMELLMHYSAMSTNTSAPMHHHAAPEQPPAVHVDDASSQCCESRPRRRAKRSRDDVRQQGTKRLRNYALIEVHVSNSAGPRKVNHATLAQPSTANTAYRCVLHRDVLLTTSPNTTLSTPAIAVVVNMTCCSAG